MSTKYYGAADAAKAVGITLGSFRVKVCLKGVKGVKKGRKVFYTKTQINTLTSANA